MTKGIVSLKMMGHSLSTKNLLVFVGIASALYILTVATSSNAQSKNDDKKETSISSNSTSVVANNSQKDNKKALILNGDKTLDAKKDLVKKRGVRDVSLVAEANVAKSNRQDLDTAAGGKKYMLVKKKPKVKKIKMDVYKPKMKYKKIKMKVPVKKMKKKKVKGYMVKKKKHYY